jgi:hypothetical protein
MVYMLAVFQIVVSFGKQNEKYIPKFELLWKSAAWNTTRRFETNSETDYGEIVLTYDAIMIWANG